MYLYVVLYFSILSAFKQSLNYYYFYYYYIHLIICISTKLQIGLLPSKTYISSSHISYFLLESKLFTAEWRDCVYLTSDLRCAKAAKSLNYTENAETKTHPQT